MSTSTSRAVTYGALGASIFAGGLTGLLGILFSELSPSPVIAIAVGPSQYVSLGGFFEQMPLIAIVSLSVGAATIILAVRGRAALIGLLPLSAGMMVNLTYGASAWLISPFYLRGPECGYGQACIVSYLLPTYALIIPFLASWTAWSLAIGVLMGASKKLNLRNLILSQDHRT